MNRNTFIPLTYALALQREGPSRRKSPYQRILVPLDGSEEAEKAFAMAQQLLPAAGRGILLRVIRPGKSRMLGENLMLVSKEEEARRAGAMGYLRCVVDHLAEVPGRWRCEVVVSVSVGQAIADFSRREAVDLIAMYTHDRKGLSKLVRGSIAEKVQERAPAELRVLRPRELVAR